eukprot:scaffold135736_cov28-Prasinocladus_malaysianus.AAC.2
MHNFLSYGLADGLRQRLRYILKKPSLGTSGGWITRTYFRLPQGLFLMKGALVITWREGLPLPGTRLN